MDFQKEDQCWACCHSEFNPAAGILHCYQDEDRRSELELCPFSTTKQANITNENNQDQEWFVSWRAKLAKLIK